MITVIALVNLLNLRVREILGAVIKKLDQRSAVMLLDDIHQFRSQLVLTGQLYAVFNVRGEDQGTHRRGQLVMLVTLPA